MATCHPPRVDASQRTLLDIAINLLLRCEHLLRDLAFECTRDIPASEKCNQLSKQCADFHETLFVIDHELHRYRTKHTFSRQTESSSTSDAYRLLSDINEQLTDYAFLVGQKVHPWDIPYKIECDDTTTSAATATSNQCKFPPATWRNRVLRQKTTPLAGFTLKNSNPMRIEPVDGGEEFEDDKIADE